MHNIPVSYVNPHMPCIADNIPRLGFGIRNLPSGTAQFPRGTGHGVSLVFEHPPYKTGAVGSVSQAGSSGHIGIADKLAGIIGNGLPARTAAGRYADR